MADAQLSSLDVLLGLTRFHAAIEEIRKIYPRMELGQLDLLLAIAQCPAVTGAELLEQSQGSMSKSGFYKALATLSDERPNGSIEGRVTGLGLIARTPNPDDGRGYLLVLTRKGKALMEGIAGRIAAREREASHAC